VRRVLGTALLVAATTVSCGDSSEHAAQRTDGQPAAVEGQAAPQTAATQPAVPTTTTIPMLVAWIDESEPEDGPAPLAVKFISMVKGGVPPYSYKWVFDDGSEPSTEAHPVHTYAEKGLYWPELYVTDTRGEEDEDTTVVEAR
jgi:PKD repeat protein